MINTRKALTLFNLLNKHLPDDTSNIVVLDFVGKIIDSIIQKNEHSVYSDAIVLMYDLASVENLKDEHPEEILQMFITGLIENRIIDLRDFFRKVYHGIP